MHLLQDWSEKQDKNEKEKLGTLILSITEEHQTRPKTMESKTGCCDRLFLILERFQWSMKNQGSDSPLSQH